MGALGGGGTLFTVYFLFVFELCTLCFDFSLDHMDVSPILGREVLVFMLMTTLRAGQCEGPWEGRVASVLGASVHSVLLAERTGSVLGARLRGWTSQARSLSP